MRKLYDFSKAKPNPYVGKLKRQITIRLETSTIDYFRELAKELGIPYQNLINMYLRECALAAKRPALKWS
jgi:predicted DNA binding CopG/RHH family protein